MIPNGSVFHPVPPPTCVATVTPLRRQQTKWTFGHTQVCPNVHYLRLAAFRDRGSSGALFRVGPGPETGQVPAG